MFGLGIQELLLLVAVAVVVIGPKHLPKLARNFGRMLAQFQRAGNELRDLMHEEAERLEKDTGLDKLKQEAQQGIETWDNPNSIRNYTPKKNKENKENNKQTQLKAKAKAKAQKQIKPQVKAQKLTVKKLKVQKLKVKKQPALKKSQSARVSLSTEEHKAKPRSATQLSRK